MPEGHAAALLDGRPGTSSGPGWRCVELFGRGTTFACDQPGPSPDAPAVVLLHGWTATGSLNWAPTISRLSQHYRVIALDHRGHGRGIRSAGAFTLEDCADDAVALLDALGVRRAIFVGYSMGGPIAQLVWRRHPRSRAGLVLCATAGDFTMTPERWPIVWALDEVQRATRVVPRSLRLRVARPLLGGLVADPGVRSDSSMRSQPRGAGDPRGRAGDPPVRLVELDRRDRRPGRRRDHRARSARAPAVTAAAGGVDPGAARSSGSTEPISPRSRDLT